MRTSVRYGVHSDGKRYIARSEVGGSEHAVWRDGQVEWLPHMSGGTMAPFDGPDDVYAELTRGGLHLWETND